MTSTTHIEAASPDDLHDLCARLFPICRSLTGNGVRDTLRIIQETIPLEFHEIPTGKKVFDWEVPPEWNLREAYIENDHGERVVDTTDSNLHVVSYSVPTDIKCSLADLQEHLFSLPDRPDWIPYRTAYYSNTWGFCLTHAQRETLSEGTYHVKVDSTLEPGVLSYGELLIPGQTEREILISAHICHPSMVNDNLSGVSVAVHLAKYFADKPLRFGLRFVFAPATVGAITWLAENEDKIARISDGLVISGVGDPGSFTYKTSRRGDGIMDKLFAQYFSDSDHTMRPFLPYGYDERQYCSPGIDIAMGCLMRTPYGEYDQYHTSADNLEFVQSDQLKKTLDICISAITDAQRDVKFINTAPKCEPQLGKRGLYEPIGGNLEFQEIQMAQFWLLSYSDGSHSLFDIQKLSGIDFATLETATDRLAGVGLLVPDNSISQTGH